MIKVMRKIIISLLTILVSVSVLGQKTTKLKVLDIKLPPLEIQLPSTVLIKGTSTLHDWESIVEKTYSKLTLENIDDIKQIETLKVKVISTSIKSGKKLMDRLTYEALKSEQYRWITFEFKSGELISENNKEVVIKLHGDLSIAGVTKSVSVLTNINKKGEHIFLTGSYKLKMTDYGITPPKALFGTIKTGDEIIIEFNLKF